MLCMKRPSSSHIPPSYLFDRPVAFGSELRGSSTLAWQALLFANRREGSFRKNGSGHLVHQMGRAFSHPTVAQGKKPGCASELCVVWDAMDRARIIATPTAAAVFVIARQVPLDQRAAVVRGPSGS